MAAAIDALMDTGVAGAASLLVDLTPVLLVLCAIGLCVLVVNAAIAWFRR